MRHTHTHSISVINFNENINFPNHEFKYNLCVRICIILCHVSHMFESISIKSKIHVCKGNSYVCFGIVCDFHKVLCRRVILLSSHKYYSCVYLNCVVIVIENSHNFSWHDNKFYFHYYNCVYEYDWNMKCEADAC